jgi:hypothetical protein
MKLLAIEAAAALSQSEQAQSGNTNQSAILQQIGCQAVCLQAAKTCIDHTAAGDNPVIL